jgi:hypothetical protein
MGGNTKKVKLMFDAQFCGYAERIIEVPAEADEDYIKGLFPEEMGIPFDDNCFFEILENE